MPGFCALRTSFCPYPHQTHLSSSRIPLQTCAPTIVCYTSSTNSRFLETSFHAVPQQHQPNSIRNHNYSNGRTAPSSDLSRTFCNQTRTAEECGIRVNGRAFCNTLKISVACCMCPECLSGCQRRRQRLISLSSRVVSNSNTACTLASPSDIVASVGGLAIEQSSIPFCLKAKRQRKTNYFCLTILLASLSHSLSFFILYARDP